MFSATDAKKMAEEIEKEELLKAELEKKEKEKIRLKESSDLGAALVVELEKIWEKEVKEAIKNKRNFVEIYKDYFSKSRYLALCSSEVKEFCDKLKTLGFDARPMCIDIEEYGSRHDPDFYCPACQEAYLLIRWER